MNEEVIVVEQRSPIEKIWAKHKKPIMVIGAIVVGYYIYTNYKK
jgi:hypothetical protein